MRISELVEALKERMAEHGDVEVAWYGSPNGSDWREQWVPYLDPQLREVESCGPSRTMVIAVRADAIRLCETPEIR